MSQAQIQTLEEIRAAALALVDIDDDMTEIVSGGAGGRKLPVGKTLARFVTYIEYGKQPQEFQGQVKDPALEFRLGFALYGPGFANPDGTPYILETFNISRSRNEKATAFILFKQMNYLGTAKNFAQLLGQAFIVDIVDYVSKAAPAGTAPRSIVNTKLILPPLDLVTNAAYAVPEVSATDLHLFAWALPSLAGWDKLFIDGQNDKGESKNWIQGTIVAATDFPGSPLESLLIANQRPIPVAQVRKARKAAAAPVAGAAPVGALPVGVVPVALVAPAAPVAVAVAPVAAVVPLAPVAVIVAPVAAVVPAAPVLDGLGRPIVGVFPVSAVVPVAAL